MNKKETIRMKHLIAAIVMMSCCARAAVNYEAGLSVDLSRNDRFDATVDVASGQPVLQMRCQVEEGAKKPTTVAYYSMPVSGFTRESDGLSFEVRGQGDPVLASVMVAPDKGVHIGWEATFFAEGSDWRTVRIRWDEFAPNCKPWNPGRFVDGAPLDPATIGRIAFGRGNQFHKDQPMAWGFDVRNVKEEADLPQAKVPSDVPEGLSRTRQIVKRKGHLNILLLGDSITMHGKGQSYAHHFARKLKEQFGITYTVSNMGIGGHSVRGGRLVLKRSLRTMPNPDLVFMMYGANDCKGVSYGLTKTSFKGQIEALVDDLRVATGGKSDIVILNGLPRLNKERTKSKNVVEPIVPGIHAAAESRGLVLVDTFNPYLGFSQEQINTCYKDTIHQAPAGQEFIGELVHEELLRQMQL
jgi:lysophospholipase L1-like esterase